MKYLSKLSILFIAVALMTFGLTMTGCKKSDQNQTESSYIVIKGSDTMVHLVSTWAEHYMKMNPNMEISVTGGGSGTGIAALLNGTTDICAASRKMKGKEFKLAEQKNMQPKEFIVGRDGIAVVLNPNNPIKELTMEQLMKMFTGAITNWNQVGGPDKPIALLSRESNSGTYVFFQEHVLKKKDYTPSALLMPASSSIIQTVQDDAWSIGYVGLAYALEAGDKVSILSVKSDETSAGVAPSNDSVKTGSYPIARPLHLYTAGEPTGATKAFIDFCFTAEGQRIVQETGYVSIN